MEAKLGIDEKLKWFYNTELQARFIIGTAAHVVSISGVIRADIRHRSLLTEKITDSNVVLSWY